MRKNMPYPKKRLKEKKERKIHRVRVFGGTENKILLFFCPFGTYVLGGRQKQIV